MNFLESGKTSSFYSTNSSPFLACLTRTIKTSATPPTSAAPPTSATSTPTTTRRSPTTDVPTSVQKPTRINYPGSKSKLETDFVF